MRKLFFFIALITIAINANAQFTLTYNGLVNTDDPQKKYVILDFEGKSKAELFNLVNVYLHSLYISPQDVVSTVNGEAITINGVSTNAIYIKKNKTKVYDIKYSISIAFKDGRIKINAPYIVNMYCKLGNNEIEYGVQGLGYPFYSGVYKIKDKQLLNKYAKESIELFVNSYILSLKQEIENGNNGNNDEW